VLDREIHEVDSVVDGQSHNRGVVIGKDGRDTQIERLAIKSAHCQQAWMGVAMTKQVITKQASWDQRRPTRF
jgi:hypothetical protein